MFELLVCPHGVTLGAPSPPHLFGRVAKSLCWLVQNISRIFSRNICGNSDILKKLQILLKFYVFERKKHNTISRNFFTCESKILRSKWYIFCVEGACQDCNLLKAKTRSALKEKDAVFAFLVMGEFFMLMEIQRTLSFVFLWLLTKYKTSPFCWYIHKRRQKGLDWRARNSCKNLLKVVLNSLQIGLKNSARQLYNYALRIQINHHCKLLTRFSKIVSKQRRSMLKTGIHMQKRVKYCYSV